MDERRVSPSYDVVIAGGGMVGASLALALATLPLRVLVVEARPPQDPGQPSYDDRATALSLGSRRIYDTLGLWPSLRAGVTPIRRIHVSDRGGFGVTRIDHRDEGVPALGYVIENRVLGSALWRALAESDAVELCTPALVESVASSADSVRVSLGGGAGGRTVTARLLVAADGARSAVREHLSIAVRRTDYDQCAIITNVTPRRFHEHVAYERFTGEGPLAMLPMSNGRCSVVWTVAKERAGGVADLDDAGFLAALQETFGHRLGRLGRVGARVAYPLALVRAERIVGERFALVGNAAQGLHPVAGQGFNLGLRDVAVLAECVADALQRGGDAGDPAGLRAFAGWREQDQDRVVGFTHGLVRLFGHRERAVRAVRGAGLAALDLLTPPRRVLARQSMGLSGRVPRLARGVALR